jgi:carboxyl-terminal processing protease
MWQLLNDSTGYIKINRFAETFEEFKMGLLKLKKEQVLVIDLRDMGRLYGRGNCYC